MNRLYQLFIHKKVFEVPHELYFSKLFVNMAIVFVFSIGIQVTLTYLGLFNNPGPVIYALLAGVVSLVLNKITGNTALSSNIMLVGVIIVMLFIVAESGGIYSYTLRWMICILIVAFLFSNNERKSLLLPLVFTGVCIGVVLLFYYVALFDHDKNMKDLLSLSPTDYAIDNIIFILTLSALAFLIQRVQNLLLSQYQDQNKHLKSANQELERFAFIASHDLKEPVRNICSFSQLALNRLDKNDTEGAREFLMYVVNNSSQMNTLIKSTLELMSHNQHSKQSVDLNVVMNQVSELVKEEITDKSFKIQIQDSLPTVEGCPNELLTCLKHLVTNGITFNQSEQPKVLIRSEFLFGETIIFIKDNGTGIDPQYQQRIFSMYTRLEHRSVHSGPGLGLSICKKLIERWGGRIWVNSILDEGSVFCFTIPSKSFKLN